MRFTMGKNKKKKKKETGILYNVDMSLNSQYEGIKDEIEFLQEELKRADKKGKKKAKKKMKKGGFYPYHYELEAREKVIRKMEKSDLLSRTESCLNDLKPICTIIARLIAALILAILSIDAIKTMIRPDTLAKMGKIYEFAMSF